MTIGKDFRGTTDRYKKNKTGVVANSIKNLKPEWKPGQSGNPLGRPRNMGAEDLRKALATVQKTKGGVSFLEMFVEKAYKDKDYAIALFKKIIPTEAVVTKLTKKLIVNFAGKLDDNIKPENVMIEVENLDDKKNREV